MRASKRALWVALAMWLLAASTHLLVSEMLFSASVGHATAIARRIAGHGSCRVFLAGSSGVLFGMSAGDIEAATGCATVNATGFLLGRRLGEFLPELLKVVAPGDVVVLSDRCWTGVTLESNPCTMGGAWFGWLQEIRLVPNIAADIRNVLDLQSDDQSLQRSHRGDLLIFPPLRASTTVVSELNTETMAAGAKLAHQQLALLQMRGARVVLAAAPLLVTRHARPEIEATISAWNLQMVGELGPDIWVGPWVDTDTRLFTAEGQHLSELGRQRWSRLLASAVLRALNAPAR